MRRRLEAIPGLELIEGEASELLLEEGAVAGVALADGARLLAPAVVLTTGTFLAACMHRGQEQTAGGRIGDGSAAALSNSLAQAGLRLGLARKGRGGILLSRVAHLELVSDGLAHGLPSV